MKRRRKSRKRITSKRKSTMRMVGRKHPSSDEEPSFS
jgi:hypothetical protein